MIRIELDWNQLLGFNHATKNPVANAAKVGDKVFKPAGASADFCVASLGAKIGSKTLIEPLDRPTLP
jgi:hypothetical protein